MNIPLVFGLVILGFSTNSVALPIAVFLIVAGFASAIEAGR
jgi:uncharacterized membrane protein YphA (DoxX/SURF4 family)